MSDNPVLWTVAGSCGNLLIDASDGEILHRFRYSPEDTEYDIITRFDVDEYRVWLNTAGYTVCNPQQNGIDGELDILDIGFWEGDVYEPACAEHRTRWWITEEQNHA